MKKAYLLIVLFLFCLWGCIPSKVVDIQVTSIPKELALGKFDDAKIKMKLTHANGEIEEVLLTESLLPESQAAKLDNIGIVTIEFVYEGLTVSFDLTIVKHLTNTNEKNHNYVVVDELLPTCTEEGYQELVCECGVSTTKVLETVDHTESDWIIDVETTCLAKGSKHIECTVCHKNLDTEEIEILEHDYTEWEVVLEATCTEKGSQERVCQNDYCGKVETKEISVKPHPQGDPIIVDSTCYSTGLKEIYCTECDKNLTSTVIAKIDHYDEDEDHYCDMCCELLFIDQPYYLESEEKIIFGTYPQELVNDDVLYEELLTLVGSSIPSVSNPGEWNLYNMNNEKGENTNSMWYKDVTYNSIKYRAVYIAQYRSEYTGQSSLENTGYQKENGYYAGKVYIFEYTPIRWNVVDSVDGKTLIIADLIIDSREFNSNSHSTSINGVNVNANNYEQSSIRQFLIDEFYQMAFNAAAQAYIHTTLIDNKSDTEFGSNDTEDAVFLLSTDEYLRYFTSTIRLPKATDYAKALGCELVNGVGSQLLRSSYQENSNACIYVDTNGKFVDDYVNRTVIGVSPLIWITLE